MGRFEAQHYQDVGEGKERFGGAMEPVHISQGLAVNLLGIDASGNTH
jgi:hypothetical protein